MISGPSSLLHHNHRIGKGQTQRPGPAHLDLQIGLGQFASMMPGHRPRRQPCRPYPVRPSPHRRPVISAWPGTWPNLNSSRSASFAFLLFQSCRGSRLHRSCGPGRAFSVHGQGRRHAATPDTADRIQMVFPVLSRFAFPDAELGLHLRKDIGRTLQVTRRSDADRHVVLTRRDQLEVIDRT